MTIFQITIRMFIAAFLLFFACDNFHAHRLEEPSDSFKTGTLWQGELVYEKSDYFPESKPLVMILYIKQRKGVEFEAITWYPTRENGLLKVTGRLGDKGEITFKEQEVIHGEATAKRNTGVLAGMKFVGQLDQTNFKGSGEWTGPAFNGEIRVKYSLRLAK